MKPGNPDEVMSPSFAAHAAPNAMTPPRSSKSQSTIAESSSSPKMPPWKSP